MKLLLHICLWTTVILFSGCQSAPQNAKVGVPLTQTRWVLSPENNPQLIPEQHKQDIFLQFTSDDPARMHGKAACNSFSAQVSIEKQQMSLGPLISTRMACPSLEQEYAFFQALESVNSYMISGDTLTLLHGGEPVLVFSAAPLK